MITVSWQTIITIGAVIGAICAIMGKYNKAYDLVKHQHTQDATIKEMQIEQTVILKGVLACLKGLSEQGCDGPVKEAEAEIQNYLISKSHVA